MERTPRKKMSVRMWLVSIDSSLAKYTEEFEKMDFENTNCLKFFRKEDFEKFSPGKSPSVAHKRMILHAVSKLQTPTSARQDEYNKQTIGICRQTEAMKTPKRLNFDDRSVFSTCKDNVDPDFLYKSPVETMLEDIREQLKLKESEFRGKERKVFELTSRYSRKNIITGKGIQCGKCHLREGHRKAHCQNEECSGPEICNDIDKHPSEKKELNDANTEMNRVKRVVDKIKNDLSTKEMAAKETRSSFKYQIINHVINSDLEKYTCQSTTGRILRQTVLNNDIFILQQHYNNKVPRNLNEEKCNFKSIIDTFNDKFIPEGKKDKQCLNENFKKLESKGICFPDFKEEKVQPSTDGIDFQPKDKAEETEQLERALQESLQQSSVQTSKMCYGDPSKYPAMFPYVPYALPYYPQTLQPYNFMQIPQCMISPPRGFLSNILDQTTRPTYEQNKNTSKEQLNLVKIGKTEEQFKSQLPIVLPPKKRKHDE